MKSCNEAECVDVLRGVCVFVCVCEKIELQEEAGSLTGWCYKRARNIVMRDVSSMFERVFVCSWKIKSKNR